MEGPFHPIIQQQIDSIWKDKLLDKETLKLLQNINRSIISIEGDRELNVNNGNSSASGFIDGQTAKEELEKRFENLFNYSSIGMAITDLNGKLLDMNRQMEVITGYTKEELQAMGIWDLNHPDDNTKNQELFQKLLAGDVSSYVHRKRYIHKCGKIVYVVVTASKFIDPKTLQPQIMAQVQDVSELVTERTRLADERHRFEEMIWATEASTWEWNIQTGEAKFSDNFAELLGYSPQELFPLDINSWTKLIHPEDRKKSDQLLQNHLKGKSDYFQSEIRLKHKNGSWVWVLNRGKIGKRLPDEKPSLMFGVQLEITNEVRMRKRLEETSLIFDQAQAIANLGSWRWRIAKNKVYWSDSIFNIFKDEEVFNGMSYQEYFRLEHPGDKKKLAGASKKAMDELSTFEVEHRVVLKNNQVKWLLAKGGLVMDDDGNAEELYGILRDITKEKLIEEELRTSKEQYQLLADNGHEIISLLNLDGSYAYCSPALVHLTGFSPSDFVEGKIRFWDMAYVMDVETLYDAFQASMANVGETYTARGRFQDVEGNFKWYEKSFKAVADERGNILFVRALKQDIEKQLEYEQRLKDTNIALEESLEKLKLASQAKENFLSIMSHEIRTPLNSVIGLTNLLLRRNPREDQYEIIKTLKSSSDNLMHLVNDILDYNKIQAGKVELEFIAFRLSHFLSHLYNSFKQLAEERNLDFRVKSDPQIPDILIGDVTRLNQIFTNLINNAIKFTRQGTVTVEATLRSLNDSYCSVAFDIIDTGIGIASDKLDTIFEPFQQSEANVSRQFGGTGLGLSIVKNLVQMFGGGLSVESTVGQGSVFTIVIDFKISHYIGEVEVTKNKPRELSQKLNVLYVEDVESNRFLVQNLLDDNGMHCHLAFSGEDALKKTLETKFDVILMDIQMPGMDGYLATDKIRSQEGGKNRETPIIAFTAEPFSEKLKAKVLSHKIQDVITKPFEIDAFVEKINMISGKNSEEKDAITLGFYEKAFNGDKAKLKHIKGAVIEDVSSFINNFKEAENRQSVSDMRAEIHRIRPIMKNIGAVRLVNLLDQFKLHEEYSAELVKMSSNVEKIVKNAIEEIEKLEY